MTTPNTEVEEFLQHHGVKGMKWGVRKKRESTPQETRAVKTSSGKDMTLVKQNTSGLSKLLAKISPAIKSNVENSSFFDIADDTGKKVGSLQIFKESKDVLNVVWVDTKSSQKGKGYATAAMKETIKIAKEQGLKKVTLEVPGDSPDALHIYKKLGFKETGTLSDEDDVWGGLTNMELDLKHSYTDEVLQHHGVKGMKWGVRKDKKPSDRVTTKEAAKSYLREIKSLGGSAKRGKMSDEELKTTVARLRKENELKRLTSKGNKDAKKTYIRREKLTDAQLETKLKRLRLEDQLKQESRAATKDQREFANMVLKDVAKRTLSMYTENNGDFRPTDNPGINVFLNTALKEYIKKQ